MEDKEILKEGLRLKVKATHVDFNNHYWHNSSAGYWLICDDGSTDCENMIGNHIRSLSDIQKIVDLQAENKHLQERINKIAIVECSDYPNVKDENAFSQLWAIEQTMQGIKQANEEVHAKWEESKAENAELKEIAKAVAHIGIDFGYGKYEIQQKEIDKARALLDRSEGE